MRNQYGILDQDEDSIRFKYKQFDFTQFLNKYIEEKSFGAANDYSSALTIQDFSYLPFWKSILHYKRIHSDKNKNILDKYIEDEINEKLKKLKDECVYPAAYYEFLDYFLCYKDPICLKLNPEFYKELYTNVEVFDFKYKDPPTK